MALTFKDLCERLAHLDEITLLEVLDIASEDLVDKFKDKKHQYFLLWYDGESKCFKGRKFINMATFIKNGTGEWQSFVKESIIVSDDGTNTDLSE